MRSRRETSDPRRGLSRAEAARFVGISPALFDRLVDEERLPKPVQLEGEEVFDLIQLDLAFDRISGGLNDKQWRIVK